MDEQVNGLTLNEINELADRRIKAMQEDGIDELEVLKDAQTNTNNWNNWFNENITVGKDDMNFTLRDQWTAIERSEFNRVFKPAMTFNKIYDAVKKTVGEQRKNKPDLLVRSLTGLASQEEIDIRADLIRTIAYQSQNDLVYQIAFKMALLRGYGAFQIVLDYETPTSFDQIARYIAITDPTMCTWDPKALKPHKGDGNWCSRDYVYSKDEFYATYPFIVDAESFTDPRTLLDFQWETRDTITVCDYYRKEWFSTIIYKLSNGKSVTRETWEEMKKNNEKLKKILSDSPVVGKMITSEMPTIKAERQGQDYRIMHYRLIKNQIIDYAEWPSKQLPIIFVDGDSTFIDGKQYTKSFVHEARDAQKFINYVGSEIAAEIKNRRREQWLGTPDNIIGNEQQWRNPELQMGILIAKPDKATGQMPVKMPAWEISQGLLAQYQRGTQDIKEILGFFESMQGQPSNAISGVAEKNRQLASSMSSYVFSDNLNQAIEQGGRVVLDLLPVIYGGDEPRTVVVSKKDGKTHSLILNEPMPDGSLKNQILPGDFDIEIDTGPSFAVQKEAALELLLQLVQTNPQVFPMVADLIAKNLDVQFMPQIAERFRNFVPPEILAKEDGLPPPPPRPDPQQEMMQMQQQMMQQEMKIKEQQLAERADELRIRDKKHQLEEAELILKAQKMRDEMAMSRVKVAHDNEKAELDFNAKIAKVLADLHKDQNSGSSNEE